MSDFARRLTMAAATGFALACNSSPAAIAEQPPAPPSIEAFAALPMMSGFSVSPDGRHMAALQARGDEQVILVWQADRLDLEPTVIGANQMRIRGVTFVKNDVLGVTLWQPLDSSMGGRMTLTFLSKFMLTDLEGRNWRDPSLSHRTRSAAEERMRQFQSPEVIDTLPNDPDHIMISLGGDVLHLNVRTNRSQRIHRASERVLGYSTDLEGELRVRSVVGRDSDGLYVAAEFRASSGSWEEHFRSHIRDRETFAVVGFAADPNIAYVVSDRNRDKSAIFEYDVSTRTLGEVVFEHPLFETVGMSIDRVRGDRFGEVRSVTYLGPRSTAFPISPDYEALRAGLEQALGVEERPMQVVDPATGQSYTIDFPDQRYLEFVSASDDFSTAVVWVGGPDDPGAYFLFRNGRLSPLGQPYPEIAPETLGSTSLVYYEARDGLTIPAFLSTPSEEIYGPGPYPAIVMPHGGPWSRDDLTWDRSTWRWLMTSRGYAVLQPQFRGSSGWGRRLWLAGDNEWGQAMQDDKDDGARWMIEQGIAQSDRVAMFGYSYGGYSAMVAAIRPNGLYQCAIAGAGVSDMTRIRSQLFRNPFTREAQRDTVNGLNPISEAGNIQIPIMLFHGDRDQTVTVDHSEQFASRARSSGQDVELHVLRDYGHGPAWNRSVMVQQLEIIDRYLREGCGSGGL